MLPKFIKKVFIFILFLAVLIYALVTYANRAILPVKLKSLITEQLQAKTQKKVSIEGLRFSIFKGLVLEDLRIYDKDKPVVQLPQVSCSVLFWPFFKKQVIIPHLHLESPVIFLERRSDKTFNLQDLFPVFSPAAKEGAGGFNLAVYGVSVRSGRIDFLDNTLMPPSAKSLDVIDLSAALSLPTSVKFRLNARLSGAAQAKINARGEFNFMNQNAVVDANIQGLSPQEFSEYYKGYGVSAKGGKIDALLKVKYEDDLLVLDLNAAHRELAFSQGKIQGVATGILKSALKYYLPDKAARFSGELEIENGSVSGLDYIRQLDNISGSLKFDNSGFNSDNFQAQVWGVPLSAVINFSDFKNPLLLLKIDSFFGLEELGKVLQDEFNYKLAAELNGNAKLSVNIRTSIPSVSPEVSGYLDITDSSAKFIKPKAALENIFGRVEFDANQLKWPQLKFTYQGLPYLASGTLKDFKNPKVEFALSSSSLKLDSSFAVDNKIIRLTKCDGQYYNSAISLNGNIDLTKPDATEVDAEGALKFDLADAQVFFGKFSEQLKEIKPQGRLSGVFSLKGNINDFKSCLFQLKGKGDEVSAYGIKGNALSFMFNQAYGIASLNELSLNLYGGLLGASARINLNSDNLPYALDFSLQEAKLEELKADTPLKKEDISGLLSIEAKLSGFFKDHSRMSGSGRINIADGKLWQLDLFKGMGALLFTSDFTNVVFNQASCSFIIQDKAFSSGDLLLKSTLADLTGSGRVGFDGALDAELDVHVSEDTPLSGTFKDVTTAVIGQAGRFGTIKITGTLKEPKYKFKTAVVDIIKGLTDIFLNNVKH